MLIRNGLLTDKEICIVKALIEEETLKASASISNDLSDDSGVVNQYINTLTGIAEKVGFSL
ncbi:MAG: hypothetical protein ABH883_04720 [Candidatus Omnitrophota bacterium]